MCVHHAQLALLHELLKFTKPACDLHTLTPFDQEHCKVIKPQVGKSMLLNQTNIKVNCNLNAFSRNIIDFFAIFIQRHISELKNDFDRKQSKVKNGMQGS